MSYNLKSILNSVNVIILTIALVMSNNLQAQESNQASSLLWEITGKKVKSPSYLMGTMHLIPKDKFYFPDDLREKVSETKLLVMEIGGIEEQMKAAGLIMLKDGNLFDHFSQPQKDTLFQYLQTELEMDSSIVKQQFSRVKPFALLQLMTRSAFGENPESYELTLQGIAMQKNIPIKGLETVEDQMAVFDNMGMEEQVEMVMSSIRNSENSADEMN
ncbi:MAG: TraB/GumN family protein, partial [Crocinitomicaceae bacterium]|nr:TraB/GumN family protein [Crocinitomicaceae bacterium]